MESDNNYCRLFFEGHPPKLVTRSMKEMEAILSPHRFLRVHNSHLINLARLKHYVKGDGGYVIMSDESSIPVSRSRKDDLLKLFA
ncbi:MAG: LytTR family DNA-binding domain-containing protein [Bacteroidota bacterium]